MNDLGNSENAEVGALGFGSLILAVLLGGFGWYIESLAVVITAFMMVLVAMGIVIFSRQRSNSKNSKLENERRSPAQGSFVELGVNPEAQRPGSQASMNIVSAEKSEDVESMMPQAIESGDPSGTREDMSPEDRRLAEFVSDPENAIRVAEHSLYGILQNTKAKLERISPVFSKRLHKNTSTDVDAMLRINQIVSVMEERLLEIQQLKQSVLQLGEGQSLDLSNAIIVLYADLILPQDSLHSVSTDTVVDGLPLSSVEEELGKLFTRLSRKKTFYKALKLDDEF